MGGRPVVADAQRLALGGHVEGVDVVALAVGVLGRRLAVGADGESVAPADEAQDVVERVVLHHHHDDVLDLRNLVGPGGQVGPGQ